MLLVAVIFLVFLGIMLHKSSSPLLQESKEADMFLTSMVEVTTPCQISSYYTNVRELISYCNTGLAVCSSGQTACSVLQGTIRLILNQSFYAGPGKAIKGYEFIALDNSTGIERKINETWVFAHGGGTTKLGSQKDIGNKVTLKIELYYD